MGKKELIIQEIAIAEMKQVKIKRLENEMSTISAAITALIEKYGTHHVQVKNLSLKRLELLRQIAAVRSPYDAIAQGLGIPLETRLQRGISVRLPLAISNYLKERGIHSMHQLANYTNNMMSIKFRDASNYVFFAIADARDVYKENLRKSAKSQDAA